MSFHIFRHLENSQLIESNRTNRKTKNMHVFSKDTLKNNYKLIFHDKNSLSFLKYKTSYKNKLDTEKNFKFQNVFFTFVSFFIFVFAIGCTDDSGIRTGDGIVEPRLEEVTGVTTAKIKSILPEQELTIDELYAFAVERTERIALREEAIQQADAQKAAAFASFFLLYL